MNLFNFRTGYWGLLISSFLALVEVGHAALPLIIVQPIMALIGLVEYNDANVDTFYSIGWTLSMAILIVCGKLLLKRHNQVRLLITLTSILALIFLTPLIKPYTESELIFQSVNIISLTILLFPIFLLYSVISLFLELLNEKTTGNNRDRKSVV